MRYIYEKKRTLTNFFIFSTLLIETRLPGKRIFDKEGKIKARIYEKSKQYHLPNKYRKKYGLQDTEFKDVYVMDSGKKGKTIFYIHGGAYWSQPTSYHFAFIKRLLRDNGGKAVIPIYPKAPLYTVHDVFHFIEPVYNQTIKMHGVENVVLMGDSAGGGFCLSFGLKLIKEDKPVPQIIAISPWMDLSCSNKLGNHTPDPWLNPSVLRKQGEIYAGDETINSYLVSPIKGDASRLNNVLIITGTYDILSANILEFEQKNPHIKLWIYPKRTHVFPLYTFKGDKSHVMHLIKKELNK